METNSDIDLENGLNHLEHEAHEQEAKEGELYQHIEPDIKPDPDPDPEPEPAFKSEQAMAMFVATVCDLVASRRGDHWQLAAEEAKACGEAYGALIDAYLPAQTLGPGVMAITVTALVFGPRIQQDRALAKAAKAEPEPAKEPEPEPESTPVTVDG